MSEVLFIIVPTPSRILLIRPSALGDVCRSVPVLVSLRRAYPGATIDWLVQDTFIDAIRHHPDLDNAVPFPRGLLGRTSRRGNLLPSLRWMNTYLRPACRYDLVIDAQGLFRSGLFSWWTGARRRVGYANAAELGRVFYTESYRIDRNKHTVDRMLALIEAAGIDPVKDMRLHVDPAEQAWVSRVSEPSLKVSRFSEPSPRVTSSSEPSPSCDDPGHVQMQGRARLGEPRNPPRNPSHAGRYVVLAPTSRWPGKQWPADRFTELARRLLGLGLPEILIVGGPGERDQIAPLLEWAAHELRAIDLVGKTSIARLMAVIARSSLVVANDSAALHMAVGFDRPLVALFGPTRTGLVGPYQREHDVIGHVYTNDVFNHKDAKLGRAMMERISVEQVVDACKQRLFARCTSW